MPPAGGSPHLETGSWEKAAKVPSGCCRLGAGTARVMGNEVQGGTSGHRHDCAAGLRQGPLGSLLGLFGVLSANNPQQSPALSHFRAPPRPLRASSVLF